MFQRLPASVGESPSVVVELKDFKEGEAIVVSMRCGKVIRTVSIPWETAESLLDKLKSNGVSWGIVMEVGFGLFECQTAIAQLLQDCPGTIATKEAILDIVKGCSFELGKLGVEEAGALLSNGQLAEACLGMISSFAEGEDMAMSIAAMDVGIMKSIAALNGVIRFASSQGIPFPQPSSAVAVFSVINTAHRIAAARQMSGGVPKSNGQVRIVENSSASHLKEFLQVKPDVLSIGQKEFALAACKALAAGRADPISESVLRAIALDSDVRATVAPLVSKQFPEGAPPLSDEQLIAICNVIAGRFTSFDKLAFAVVGTIGGGYREDCQLGIMQPVRVGLARVGIVSEFFGLQISRGPMSQWLSGFELSVLAYSNSAITAQTQAYVILQSLEANIRNSRLGKQGGAPTNWASANCLTPALVGVVQEARADRGHPRLSEFMATLMSNLKKRPGEHTGDSVSEPELKRTAQGSSLMAVMGCFEFRQTLKTKGTGACARGANCPYSHEEEAKCPKGPGCPHLIQGRCYFSNH